MSKLISIKKAADVLGVSVQTLRCWEREGKVLPVHKRGLKKPLQKILNENMTRLVILTLYSQRDSMAQEVEKINN